MQKNITESRFLRLKNKAQNMIALALGLAEYGHSMGRSVANNDNGKGTWQNVVRKALNAQNTFRGKR